MLVYLYTTSYQNVDDEEYGGMGEILKEGMMSSFATFMVSYHCELLGNGSRWSNLLLVVSLHACIYTRAMNVHICLLMSLLCIFGNTNKR